MPMTLDHLIVPARDRVAAAQQLAELLDAPWAETCSVGPFSPVYVNDQLTLDFSQASEPFPPGHFAFRVAPEEFDAILGRIEAAGIPYRSTPMGPTDMRINTNHGGRALYWGVPDGHAWEILTVSYARQPQRPDPADAA